MSIVVNRTPPPAMVYKTASGAIVSVSDAKAKPAQSLVVSMSPAQSGTGDPSPSNVRPISGWTGVKAWRTAKNVLNIVESEMISVGWDRIFPISVKEGTYTISCQSDFGASPDKMGVMLYFQDESKSGYVVRAFTLYNFGDGTHSGQITFTAEQAQVIKYIRFCFRATGTPFSVLENAQIMFSYGSSVPSAYSPYTGTTYQVEFPALGANQWDEEWEVGSLNQTTGENYADSTRIRSKNYIKVLPNTTYYFLKRGSVFEYDENKGYISNTGTIGDINSGVSFTTSPNTHYVRFYMVSTYGTTYGNNLGINYPATVTTYVPYTNTVYGGTLDLVSGVLTITQASITLVGGTEATYANNGLSSYTSRAMVTISDKAYGTKNMISNLFSAEIVTDSVGKMAGRTMSSGIEFYLPVTVPQNVTDIKAWFASNNTQVVYELATPLTYQLTPQQIQTLLGDNTVWADAGAVSLTYAARRT